jgi:Flp pilus assembly pilin Flp
MKSVFERLRLEQRGAATIELALTAPILGILIMGTVDTGLAFSRKLALEQGAQRAVEKVMQTTELANVQDTIAEEVAVQANVDADQVTVTFPKYCDNRLLPDTGRDDDGFALGDCEPAEKPAHYIQVTVIDDYDPMFSALSLGTKLPNGKYRVVAKAGMRTK